MNLNAEKNKLKILLEDLQLSTIKTLDKDCLFKYLKEINELRFKIHFINNINELKDISNDVIDLQEKLNDKGIKVWGNITERMIAAFTYLFMSAGLVLLIFNVFNKSYSDFHTFPLVLLVFICGLSSRWLSLSINTLKKRVNKLVLKDLLDLASSMTMGIIVIFFLLIYQNKISLPNNLSTLLLISFTIGYSYELANILIEKLIDRGTEIIKVIFNDV